jgi:hypothetical protein
MRCSIHTRSTGRQVSSDMFVAGTARNLFRAHLEPELIDEIVQATNGNHEFGGALFSA